MNPFIGLAIAAATLFVAALVFRLIASHRRITRYDTLLAFFALGAIVDLSSSLGVPWLSSPVAHALMIVSSLVGLLVAVEILRLVANDDQPLEHVWRWRVLTGVLVIVLVAAALIGQPSGVMAEPDWESSNLLAVYWAGYGLFQLVTCVLMFLILRRFAATLGPSPLRQVTTLLSIACVIGVYYALSLIVLAAEGGEWIPTTGLGELGYAIGTASYVFIALAWVRIKVARSGRRRHDLDFLEAVTPLWRKLAPVSPDFSLIASQVEAAKLSRDQLSLRCVRTAVEIRDWMDLLAPRLPADAYPRALAAASRALPDTTDLSDVRATATAGWITAGLQQDPPAFEPSIESTGITPEAGADLDHECDLLVAIAQVPDTTAQQVAEQITRERRHPTPA